jgi:hypothetical protein
LESEDDDNLSPFSMDNERNDDYMKDFEDEYEC